MKRVLAVVIAAVMASLSFGVNKVAWALENTADQSRDTERAQVARRLAGLRPGATVSIELMSGVRIKGVIDDIDADEITVLIEEPRRAGIPSRVVTQTVPIDAIRSIKEVRVGLVAKSVIAAAVAAGLLVLLGVCAAASST